MNDLTGDNLLNIFGNLKVKIDEANFVRVWPFWQDIVAFYPYNRLYLITDGCADLYLRDKTVRMEPDFIYFVPQYIAVLVYTRSGMDSDCTSVPIVSIYISSVIMSACFTTVTFG